MKFHTSDSSTSKGLGQLQSSGQAQSTQLRSLPPTDPECPKGTVWDEQLQICVEDINNPVSPVAAKTNENCANCIDGSIFIDPTSSNSADTGDNINTQVDGPDEEQGQNTTPPETTPPETKEGGGTSDHGQATDPGNTSGTDSKPNGNDNGNSSGKDDITSGRTNTKATEGPNNQDNGNPTDGVVT